MGGLASAFGELASQTLRSMDHSTFMQTEVGQYAKKLLQDYRMASDQHVNLLRKSDPNLGSGELRSRASGLARTQVFGKDDKAATHLISYSAQNHGPAYTQNLVNAMAMVLHEDEFLEGHEHASKLKINAQKALRKLPEYAKDPETGEAPRLPFSKTSPYTKPTELEQKVTNFFYGRYSPLVVIPHISTALNVFLSSEGQSAIRSITDGIIGTTPQELPQLLLDSGITAEGTLRILRDQEHVKQGLITKHLPGSLQDAATVLTSTPGFGPLRNWQTSFAGSASYHDALSYGKKLIQNPNDRYTLKRLEQYGMSTRDIAEIKKNNGMLSPEQLKKAIYYGVNRKIFLDQAFARSYHAQRNMFMRAFTMYHGYVSSQANFLKDEFITQVRHGNAANVAKYLTYMGAVFPVVGEGLKIAEMAGRGQIAQIPYELQDDYESLTFQKGDSAASQAAHAAGTMLESYASLGSFGIAFGIIQGFQRGYIAQQLAGPILGGAGKYAMDLGYYGVTQSIKKGDITKGSWKPAGRDALELLAPYGVGRFAAHEFLPTAAEDKRAHRRKNKAGDDLDEDFSVFDSKSDKEGGVF